MEIQGKITRVLEPITFNGKNGTMKRYGFILSNEDQRYPKNIKFDVLGDEKWAHWDVHVGQTRTVFFDIESREWNGKWYTSCNVWNIKPTEQVYQNQQVAPQQVVPQQAPQVTQTNPFEEQDNTPF